MSRGAAGGDANIRAVEASAHPEMGAPDFEQLPKPVARQGNCSTVPAASARRCGASLSESHWGSANIETSPGESHGICLAVVIRLQIVNTAISSQLHSRG